MNKSLEEEYRELRQRFLEPVAGRLEIFVRDILKNEKRIDRITARAKAVDRFLRKSEKENDDQSKKYSDPIGQIQDLIGVRIVTFYTQDVEAISETVSKYSSRIERLTHVPDSEDKFGYEGEHFILFIPRDVIDEDSDEDDQPKFFELQIKTLFQHAWGEASHDLAYKGEEPLSTDQKRRVAFAAAQAWGAIVSSRVYLRRRIVRIRAQTNRSQAGHTQVTDTWQPRPF